MTKIIIFGSGKGSNARNLLNHFKDNQQVKIAALVSDKPRRGFLDISYDFRVNLEIIKGPELMEAKWINHLKLSYRPDYILLLGFLQKIPTELINAFPGKIINLHPSLLPSFGGEGMYGKKVHEAVISAGVKQSGITLHIIDEEYDRGEILKQYPCDITSEDTADSLEAKISDLEQRMLPSFVEYLATL
ncbi:MAG: formyltransferase family protein [Bacteroidia bacterium]